MATGCVSMCFAKKQHLICGDTYLVFYVSVFPEGGFRVFVCVCVSVCIYSTVVLCSESFPELKRTSYQSKISMLSCQSKNIITHASYTNITNHAKW